MDLGIAGRVALVGGATQGIGRACAEVLVAEGARVVVTARDDGRTADVAAEIGAEAGFGWDTGDVDGAASLVDRVEERVGQVDIVVTNTGGPPAGADPLGFTGSAMGDGAPQPRAGPAGPAAPRAARDARAALGAGRRNRLDLGARAACRS